MTISQIPPHGIRANFSDTGVDGVRMDASTNSLQAIENAHHEIHGGSSFQVHIDSITANSDDDRTLLGFETPNTTKEGHLTINASASNAAEVFFYEGVTIDDGEGTELVIEDRNRVTDNTSMMLSFENPAVAGLASCYIEAEIAGANFSYVTELDHQFLVAGSGPKAIGGDSRGEQEWVLKASTKYAVVLQNIGASTNNHKLHLNWYEHDPNN